MNLFGVIFILIFAFCWVSIPVSIILMVVNRIGGKRQTVDAMIVAKRLNCARHHHGAEIISDHEPTTYHITFQIDKGPRVELQVKESQYDLMFDGERGKLTYKGKRFIRFIAT